MTDLTTRDPRPATPARWRLDPGAPGVGLPHLHPADHVSGPQQPPSSVPAFPLMWPVPDRPSPPSDRRLRLTVLALLIMIGIASEWLWIDRFLVISTTAKVGMFP